MLIVMNYFKLLTNIIENARSENRVKKYYPFEHPDYVYWEKHHIWPTSWCKGELKYLDKDKRNLVLLTAKEHLYVHYYMTKIFPNDVSMSAAIWGMLNQKNKYQKQRVLLETDIDEYYQIYEESKIRHAKNASKNNKGRKAPNKGKVSPLRGTTMPDEWKQNLIKSNGIRGKSPYTNKDGKIKFFKDGVDIIPDNFYKGFSDERNKNISNKNKGRKIPKNILDKMIENNGIRGKTQYHDKTTRKIKYFFENEDIPENYVKGIPIEIIEKITKTTTGRKHSKESITKMKLAQKGVIKTKEHKNNLTGLNNYHFKGWYLTPWGCFNSANAAHDYSSTKFDIGSIINRCKNNTTVINSYAICRSRYLTKDMIGKTYDELGFSFRSKD